MHVAGDRYRGKRSHDHMLRFSVPFFFTVISQCQSVGSRYRPLQRQASSTLSTSLWFAIIQLLMGPGSTQAAASLYFYKKSFKGIFHVTLPRPSSHTRSKMHCRVVVACGQRYAEHISVTKNGCFETRIQDSIMRFLDHRDSRFELAWYRKQ